MVSPSLSPPPFLSPFVPRAVVVTQKCMATAQEINFKRNAFFLSKWPERGASEIHRV